MITESIHCEHCKKVIGFKHYTKIDNYEDNITISSSQIGSVIKTKIRGTTYIEPFGDCDEEIGFIMESQLKCNKCLKNTTIRINKFK